MAKQVAKPKVRKKKWYPILAPKLFKEMVIGEVHLYDSNNMLNRSLTANMMNLTGNPRNQHINVMLRISEVKDGKGLTQVLGFEMMPSSVKRIVRKGRTKISDSVIVATSDNKKVRIKPLLITNTTVNKSAANSIRLTVRNQIAYLVSKLSYEKLVQEIMMFKLQKHLGSTAAKIAPIKNSEIRGFKLVEKEGVRVLKTGKIEEPVKEEKSQNSRSSETLRNEVSGVQKRKGVSRELETTSQTKEEVKEEKKKEEKEEEGKEEKKEKEKSKEKKSRSGD
ncbi:hypothetical protein AYK26_04600 [Euryarchaeota archaeon SM23-78]|nr:MAG: hypothetical protein AYK26_04600 [Euryarchaeota archaeon SM23-78]MBW3000718.1 hypothetical protein [Candidatus Woesearchaeota archaeon]